jgi:hypothetical protein
MNKKLILVLVIAVALIGTWAFAMHSKKAAETKKTMNVSIEDMPGLAHMGDVKKPTPEQTAEMLSKKGLTLEDLSGIQENFKESSIPVPADVEIRWVTPEGILDQLPLTYCTFFVIYPSGSVNYGDRALWGWPDPVYIKTWNDPQLHPEYSQCGYPIYPFEIEHVEIMIYADWPCTVVGSFEIEDFIWDHCSPYPGSIIAESPVYEFNMQGGFWYLSAYFDPPICVYDRFFVGFTLYNSMDFDPTCYEPPIPEGADSCVYEVTCVEPPLPEYDTCIVEIVDEDTTWGHPDTVWGYYNPDAKYHFALCAIHGRDLVENRSYWSYDDLPSQGVWWDALTWWPGSVRIRAAGYTADQNECPRFESWWQKETFFDTSETGEVLAYAPCGVPDFNQRPKEQEHPEIGPFDGPTALANCLWWMASAGIIDPFWDDSDQDEDSWDPDEPPYLINLIANYMNLSNCGVSPWQMDQALSQMHDDFVIWFTHNELQPPTWEEIEYNLRISQDVILLLGFWYIDTISGDPPETTWARIGGHWVTVAGVEHASYVDFPDTIGILKLSDPDLDGFEFGTSPWGCEECSNGIYIPHDPIPHPGMDTIHYDAGNTSYDCYAVSPSPSPGGLLRLVSYPLRWGEGPKDSLNLYKYEGHNLNPEFEPFQGPVPPEETEIFVEIECAKILCPERSMTSSRIQMTYNNHGSYYEFNWDEYGEEEFDYYAGHHGTLVLGSDPANLATDYGTDEDNWFTNVQDWERDNLYIPGPMGDYRFIRNHCIFQHNTLPLEIEWWIIGGFDPGEGPCENAVFVKYVIRNTGEEPLQDIEKALYLDWDVGGWHELWDNFVDGVQQYNSMWQHCIYFPEVLMGITQMPVYENQPNSLGGFGVSQERYVYPTDGWDHDTLKYIMELGTWEMDPHGTQPEDCGMLLTDHPFDLVPGVMYCNEYLLWAYNKDWPINELQFGEFLYEVMQQAGYFRGDVNNVEGHTDGACNVSDVVYLISYLFKSGSPPLPFKDQGNVNCDGETNILDVVYLISWLFRDGPPPIDKNRFFPEEYQEMFSRPSLFEDSVWNNLRNYTLPEE